MSVIEWNLNRNSECERCRSRKEPDVWIDRLRFCLANQIPIRISEKRSSRFSFLLWLHFITRNNISINYKYWLNRRVPLYSHSEPNTHGHTTLIENKPSGTFELKLIPFQFILFAPAKWQYWMLSKAGEIRRDEACLDYSGNDVVLYPCHGSKGNQVISRIFNLSFRWPRIHIHFSLSPQFWAYDINTNQIRHGSSEKCLAVVESKDKVVMEECNAHKETQKWKLENYDPNKL